MAPRARLVVPGEAGNWFRQVIDTCSGWVEATTTNCATAWPAVPVCWCTWDEAEAVNAAYRAALVIDPAQAASRLERSPASIFNLVCAVSFMTGALFMDMTDDLQRHIDLLHEIIGEWGSNRFGYSYKRAHFTEKAVNMARAIGRPVEDVHGVFKKIVLTEMEKSLGTVAEVELSTDELVEVYRRIILYLFSYGFPYGTAFPSGPDAMREPARKIAELIDVPMDRFYPVWASIISDAIEWSFEPIPDDIELPNDDDWRERL